MRKHDGLSILNGITSAVFRSTTPLYQDLRCYFRKHAWLANTADFDHVLRQVVLRDNELPSLGQPGPSPSTACELPSNRGFEVIDCTHNIGLPEGFVVVNLTRMCRLCWTVEGCVPSFQHPTEASPGTYIVILLIEIASRTQVSRCPPGCPLVRRGMIVDLFLCSIC